jgi:hypothetical protein
MRKLLYPAMAMMVISGAANAEPDNACRDFFANHTALIATEQSIDLETVIESIYDLAEARVASFTKVDTPCGPPVDLPGMNLEDAAAVPILAGRSTQYPWLIYAYPSKLPDGGQGLSAALVRFNEDGRPQKGVVVSQLLGAEGTISKIASIVNPLQIISCRQTIKLVHRRANGQVLQLPIPNRGPQQCRVQPL